jgi:hypothetical protein
LQLDLEVHAFAVGTVLEHADQDKVSLIFAIDEEKAKEYYGEMDEGRKRVLLIAASILAARKLAQWDGRMSPASEAAISDAITIAERILSKIDNRWPTKAAKVE